MCFTSKSFKLFVNTLRRPSDVIACSVTHCRQSTGSIERKEGRAVGRQAGKDGMRDGGGRRQLD